MPQKTRPTEPAETTLIPGRILVAEDDPEMRRILVEALALDGHDVYDVGDGAALLVELARNDRFHFRAVDVVLADIRMPLCSGIQVLETIRGIPLDLPFVLLSAFADADIHAHVKRLNATLLNKPVSLRELRQVMAGEVRRARALGAAGGPAVTGGGPAVSGGGGVVGGGAVSGAVRRR